MPKQHNTRRKPRLRLVTPPKQRPEQGTLTATYPEGYRAGDSVFAARAEDNQHAHLGLYDGDTVVIYETADVLAGELAAVEIDGLVYLGTYRPAPGGYFTFECNGEVSRYKPGSTALLGRICHVERRGEFIRKFRPIR